MVRFENRARFAELTASLNEAIKLQLENPEEQKWRTWRLIKTAFAVGFIDP